MASPSVRTWLRGTLVATSGVAVMVALPGWLRSLEAAPVHHASAVSAQPLVVAPAQPDAAAPVPEAVQPRDAVRYRVLADFLSKRYRVSRDALERFVRLAYAAGSTTKIDPLLILAVMAVESNFNPIAESVVGAKGLMQVIPEYHQDKFASPHGGQVNVLDPEVNIVAGARVLREYATQTGDDLVAALRLYGGTGPDPDNPYASRVLSERQRLEQIVRKVQERQAARQRGASNV